MSSYSKITRHPQTLQWEVAQYMDDYFGPHIYGVFFPSDQKTYPIELVEKMQLKEFWAADVFDALRSGFGFDDNKILKFIDCLQTAYKDRWNADPIEGGGAVEHYKNK